MAAADWVVLAVGVALIAWVNWYFFLAERGSTTAAAATGGVQQATIHVRGGYDPAEVHLAPGVPTRLLFDRQETSSCSEEVVIPAFGIRKFLPAMQQTTVELPPAAPGSYDITCGMSMLHGRLIVG